MSVWVCGEVLIDELPRGAVVGGGPANTAKALARLGHEVAFIDGISTDAYGVKARAELSADGVDLSLALPSDLATAVGKSLVSAKDKSTPSAASSARAFTPYASVEIPSIKATS